MEGILAVPERMDEIFSRVIREGLYYRLKCARGTQYIGL